LPWPMIVTAAGSVVPLSCAVAMNGAV
ncbi:MAG: hypothetical protein RLZZ127_950, partial [Planctomycetota bacterium]